MTATDAPFGGLWLPLMTPFRNGKLDEASIRRLARYYAPQPIDGLILAGTTGEGLTLSADDIERLVFTVAGEMAGAKPVVLSLSGSDTHDVARQLELTARWPIIGYLVTCPYYSRPSQEGLYQHFALLAQRTEKPIVIYNIPYRTGVNMSNDVMLRLAAIRNIAGVKDCCADHAQSFDLIRARPRTFAVLTGDDILFHGALCHGADGGILAAAHVCTADFSGVMNAIASNDHQSALAAWPKLVDLVRLLFAEPNPAPLKYWLWRTGLIDSPELRLPMTGVSDDLARRLDSEMPRFS